MVDIVTIKPVLGTEDIIAWGARAKDVKQLTTRLFDQMDRLFGLQRPGASLNSKTASNIAVDASTMLNMIHPLLDANGRSTTFWQVWLEKKLLGQKNIDNLKIWYGTGLRPMIPGYTFDKSTNEYYQKDMDLRSQKNNIQMEITRFNKGREQDAKEYLLETINNYILSLEGVTAKNGILYADQIWEISDKQPFWNLRKLYLESATPVRDFKTELSVKIEDAEESLLKNPSPTNIDNANQLLDDKITADQNPIYATVGNTTIMGEQHLKVVIDQQSEQEFSAKLAGAQTVIIEFDSIAPNTWSTVSPEKRFMQSAQEYALSHSLPIVILDSEIDNKYQLWLDVGIDISHEDFLLLAGMDLLYKDNESGVTYEESIEKLRRIYRSYHPDQTNYANDLATTAYLILYGPREINNFQEKKDLINDFLKIEATAREIFYQSKIKEIVDNDNGKTILVIVGKSHALPISQTLTDNSFTTIDQTLVSGIQATLNSIKSRISYPLIINNPSRSWEDRFPDLSIEE